MRPSGPLLLVALAGCQGETLVVPQEMVPTSDDRVVAMVDGRPLRATDVERQAKAMGARSARQALDALIESETVAAEARRRGLDGDPAVREAAEREMVRRFLQLTFEREITPATVTETELRQAYDRNRGRLDHDDLVEVHHILVPTATGDDRVRRALLETRARVVAARAAKAGSVERFDALARELGDAAVALRAETIVTNRWSAREGWTEREFADAAWALRNVGDTSGVVQTRYGYHVLYLARRIPAEHITFAEAREKLREKLWPALRRREFVQFAERLVARHAVLVHPEPLR